MYGYIYKTTNLITGFFYIGRHKATQFEPEKYIGSGTILKRAVEKYGKENFHCELVESLDDKESLNDRERYWIAHYKKEYPELLYNITIGGEAITEGLRKIEKDSETKFVTIEEVSSYLEQGWKLSAIESEKRSRKKAHKKWKEKHPDRVKAANLKCMRNRPEKNKEAQTRYLANEENKKKHNERVKARYNKNKEQMQEYYRQYFNDPEKKAKHAEAVRKYRQKKKENRK